MMYGELGGLGSSDACPKCGYCVHCGRTGNGGKPSYPKDKVWCGSDLDTSSTLSQANITGLAKDLTPRGLSRAAMIEEVETLKNKLRDLYGEAES